MSEQTKAKLGAKLDDSPGAATSSLEFAITKPFVDVHSDRRLFLTKPVSVSRIRLVTQKPIRLASARANRLALLTNGNFIHDAAKWKH